MQNSEWLILGISLLLRYSFGARGQEFRETRGTLCLCVPRDSVAQCPCEKSRCNAFKAYAAAINEANASPSNSPYLRGLPVEFKDLNITRQFLNAIADAGFENATHIQQKAIPPIKAGQDVIGIAQTGTGKTAAYLLPILQKIKYAQENDPRVLILVPTKELVLQVQEQARALATYTDLRILGIYGGVGPKTQLELVAEGQDIVIATPGRFLELYSRGGLLTKKLKTLVLDEADRMMDMGFMPQIRRILEVIPRKRQNLLFSATFSERVEELSNEFLLWPTKVEVTPQATPVETVDQFLFKVPNFRTKLSLLMDLLEDAETFHRVIVFTRTREIATNIGKYLERKQEGDVRILHSNKGQNARINAMNDFKSGEVRILVSTDVSARGIDVPEVSHVINFSVPRTYEDYVHRIGRTGRAFKTGSAISFVDRAEEYHIGKIEELIQQQIEVLPFPDWIEVEDTPKSEKQDQAREIDTQKRKEDPNFKGAFHKRKPKSEKKKKKPGSFRPNASKKKR